MNGSDGAFIIGSQLGSDSRRNEQGVLNHPYVVDSKAIWKTI